MEMFEMLGYLFSEEEIRRTLISTITTPFDKKTIQNASEYFFF